MGTRSDIIVHRTDGKWHRIYCHWDGYLSHNGKLLFDHYTSQDKVEALVELGDLSVLGPEIGRQHPFEKPSSYLPGGSELKDNPAYTAFQEKYGLMCTAYGRDRGELDSVGTLGDSLSAVWPEQGCWTEFTYVWTEDQWFVGDPDTGSQELVNLGDALQGKIAVRPKVKAFGMILGQHAAHDPKKPDKHTWSSPKPRAKRAKRS